MSGIQKALATAFILLFLFVALTDILPTSRSSTLIEPVVEPVRVATGFHQGWALFSPNPLSVEANASAVTFYADGSSELWAPTEDMNRINSTRHERWRKWETRVRLDDNDEYWEATARYVASRSDSSVNPPVRVRLIRSWSDVPPPNEDKDNRVVQVYHFYEWDVVSETGKVLGEADQP